VTGSATAVVGAGGGSPPNSSTPATPLIAPEITATASIAVDDPLFG
jgi:hypothetical protein